jgi:hypothetical protein
MAALAKRLISVLVTATIAVVMLAPAASAADAENQILNLLNGARAANGLAPVEMHADLADDAMAWTLHMQGEGSLSHNPNLAAVTTGWDKLGENVGVGTSTQALHDAFMASSSHRGNILGDYNYVGIAVVAETPTKLWVTVVFMKSLGASVAEPADAGDPDPYAKEQPEPATQQPQPDAEQPGTQPPPAAPAQPQPTPAEEIVGFDRTATMVFAV